MWPWEHAVLGYLVYAVLSIAYRRRPLSTREAVVLVLGTQIPDLIDKPLAWSFSVLPNGRALGHSLLLWIVVAVLVVYVADRLDRLEYAPAFLVGYLLHILSDALLEVLAGEIAMVTFLLWPILPSPPDPVVPSVVVRFSTLELDDIVRALLVSLSGVLAHVLLTVLPWHAVQKEQG